MGHCDSWAIPYHEGEIDSRCSRCQGSLYPNSVWQGNIYFEYIQRWWGECVFHMIWLNQPFSKSRPTARVFLPFLRNRQITKEAFQFLESNRKLVKGHVLSYLWKCEAFSISSFRHITLPHPSFSFTITANKSLLTLQHFTMKNQEDIHAGEKSIVVYVYYCSKVWSQYVFR